MSLTSVICKLLETIIGDHMMAFLIKPKLINPSQHGFLKARSCLTNVLCFLEEITKWVDGVSPVDVSIWIFRKHLIKFHIEDKYSVKFTWYGKLYSQLDRAMAN